MRHVLLLLLLLSAMSTGACGALPQLYSGNALREGQAEGSSRAVMATLPDQDHDGVADMADTCPDTPAGIMVDSRGCPLRCFMQLQVAFDSNSDDIAPTQRGRLHELADLLRDNPRLEATLEGHSDNVGDPQRNVELSRRRAERVLAALAGEFGVPPGRLQVQAFGSARPLATNDTPSGRARNRRVEVAVKGYYAARGAWLALGRPYNMNFSTNTAALDDHMLPRLDSLGRHLRANPGDMAVLEGHSDSMGDRHSNLALSRLRAEAVRDYLMRHWGVAPERLAVAALGDAAPLANITPTAGRATNRRVSVRLHRGLPPAALVARAKAAEELALDPAASWRERRVPQVVVQTQAPLEFVGADATLTPEMQRRLESIGAVLASRPDLRVEVVSHCERLGDAQQERIVARMRAQAVQTLLEQQCQVAPERLEVRSVGADMPVATNDTPEGRLRNSRVELRILPAAP
ncbi:MAG: OmpA family protein [Desulfovibrio sp.]|nr:OmpA family protein [Desulfovibrio sp.]MCA1985256.1 OmpA family protein [Desulfovibrio sp.]